MRLNKIVILTGAGVSAESGLATFRGPDGLWEGHRVEDVCTPEAYSPRSRARSRILRCATGEARRRLSRMRLTGAGTARREWPGDLLLITQNVDDLHERAGSKRLLHMHGELAKRLVPRLRRALCMDGRHGRGRGMRALRHAPGRCGPTSSGSARCPTRWTGSTRRCSSADLFVSIGTSGAVYPAAGFVQTARYCGAQTLEMNLDPSLGSTFFDESRIGPAGKLVPEWVD